jgi:MFS family permease
MSAVSDSLHTTGLIAQFETGYYKWYVAAVLCAAHTVAIIDRFMMVMVTEPVRASMRLTDAQLGLLQGSGFALLYCGFAVPLGAVADATNRRNLIMAGLAMWSLASAAAAFCGSFATLFLTRIFVGFGEACLIPAGMSLLAAYFAPLNFARGTAIFGLGANFGYGLAFIGGGAVLARLQTTGGLFLSGVHFQPWQGIFLISGLLAIPVLMLLLMVREPPRPAARKEGLAGRLGTLREGLRYIAANFGSYLPFLVVGALTAVTGYAMTSWSASLFVRTYGLAAANAGKVIGSVGVIAGPLGTIAGGYVLDRLRGRGVAGAPLIIMAGGSIVAMVIGGSVGFAPNLATAIALFCVFVFESTFTLPSLYVGIQLLTPNRFRGIMASFNMMTYTLAGLGLGPAAVGFISDHVGGPHGLAFGVLAVETLMAALIIPVALAFRRSYHARVLVIGR